MRGHKKNFDKLKSYRYYNTYYYDKNYLNKDRFSKFLMMLDNVDLYKIRYKDKKQLLNVLEFIFKKYRLHKIKSNYLNGFTFINKYCSFSISEREYIVLEYILKLKKILGGYYMKNYNIYHNITLNYIEHCKRYLHFHKKLCKEKEVEITFPTFYTFPGDFCMNKRLQIKDKYYLNVLK